MALRLAFRIRNTLCASEAHFRQGPAPLCALILGGLKAGTVGENSGERIQHDPSSKIRGRMAAQTDTGWLCRGPYCLANSGLRAKVRHYMHVMCANLIPSRVSVLIKSQPTRPMRPVTVHICTGPPLPRSWTNRLVNSRVSGLIYIRTCVGTRVGGETQRLMLNSHRPMYTRRGLMRQITYNVLTGSTHRMVGGLGHTS